MTGGATVHVAEAREDQTPVCLAGFGVNPLAIRSHPGYLDGRGNCPFRGFRKRGGSHACSRKKLFRLGSERAV